MLLSHMFLRNETLKGDPHPISDLNMGHSNRFSQTVLSNVGSAKRVGASRDETQSFSESDRKSTNSFEYRSDY